MDLVGIHGYSQWETMVRCARELEDHGWDSLWLFDHFHTIPTPTQEPTFECWTACAALAQATRSIRIGQMVGCNMYRNPALLAKIAATLDVISNGRLDFGIGAGWYVHEAAAYGYDFPSAGTRIAMLDEALQIIRGLWTDQLFQFEGQYYKIGHGHVADIFHGGEVEVQGAICQPKPLQKPHPPIWVGGGGERKTLRSVARYADYANYFAPTMDVLRHKNQVLDQHCREVGRNPAEVRRSACVEVMFGSAEEAAKRQGRKLATALTGTEAAPMIEHLAQLRDEGRVEYVIVYFPDAADGDSPRRFAEEVIPALR